MSVICGFEVHCTFCCLGPFLGIWLEITFSVLHTTCIILQNSHTLFERAKYEYHFKDF